MTKREVKFAGEALEKMESLEKLAYNNSFSKKLFYKILKTVEKIEEGSYLDSDIFRKIIGTRKAWEIRVSFNKESHRFYGLYEKNDLVIMRYYLSKKSRKTPKRIIEKLKRDEQNHNM